MVLWLYKILSDLAAWPLRGHLLWRSSRGKEDAARLAERRGIASLAPPDGVVIWCHAASVGESLAAAPVIKHLCAMPDVRVVLTTGTTTSAAIMSTRLPDGAQHQYAPWDRTAWVSRFLDHWQPHLSIRMESEIWPNTLNALKSRNIPVAIINGRLSAETVRGWSRIPRTARYVFNGIDLVIAQSPTFAAAFEHLGCRTVEVAPNLKLSAERLPVDDALLATTQNAIGSRPVWLAASTHDGEEQAAIKVHQAISNQTSDLLTIVAPRHPHRGPEIRTLAEHAGLHTAQRSLNQPVRSDTDFYIVDALGELGLFYSLSPIVFVGKSLFTTGGQNPVEAAHFGCAILFGMHMENFEDIAEAMIANGSAVQVKDEDDLQRQVAALIGDDGRRATLSASAQSFVDMGSSGLDQTMQSLQRLIDG